MFNTIKNRQLKCAVRLCLGIDDQFQTKYGEYVEWKGFDNAVECACNFNERKLAFMKEHACNFIVEQLMDMDSRLEYAEEHLHKHNSHSPVGGE